MKLKSQAWDGIFLTIILKSQYQIAVFFSKMALSNGNDGLIGFWGTINPAEKAPGRKLSAPAPVKKALLTTELSTSTLFIID